MRRERWTQRILSKRLDLILETLQNLYGTSHSIGIVRFQSYVPNDSIGKFPIGFKSYKNSPFFLYSKGDCYVLEFLLVELFFALPPIKM
jgi:hypothetical protein